MRLVLEVEGERGGVDGDVVLPRKVLLARGQEPLGEEEPADPEHLVMRDQRLLGTLDGTFRAVGELSTEFRGVWRDTKYGM